MKYLPWNEDVRMCPPYPPRDYLEPGLAVAQEDVSLAFLESWQCAPPVACVEPLLRLNQSFSSSFFPVISSTGPHIMFHNDSY